MIFDLTALPQTPSSFRGKRTRKLSGSDEARPNVPFGTGGNLPGIGMPLKQKEIQSIKVGDSRLPAGQASSFVVGMAR